MSRLLRQYPATKQHSTLRPPVVIGAGIAFYGPRVRLVAPDIVRKQPRQARHALYPPTVLATPPIFFGPQTHLINRDWPRDQRFRQHSTLHPPVVIGAGIAFYGPRVKLVGPDIAAKPPVIRTRWELWPPTAINGLVPFFGPSVKQASRDRLSGIYPPLVRPKSRLRPPTAINGLILFFGPSVTLVPLDATQLIRRRPLSDLEPPVVVTTPADYASGPMVSLALQPRQPRLSHNHLAPPAVLAAEQQTYALNVSLVASRRPVAKSALHPPTVVTTEERLGELKVTLTRIYRPRITTYLFPPAVVTVSYESTVRVSLAPQPKPVARSFYVFPRFIFQQSFFGGVGIWLAPSFRGKTIGTQLAPPTVVTPADFTAPPLQTTFAPSHKGITMSTLEPPAVVAAGVVFQPTRGYLFPLDRTQLRPVKSFLRPPLITYEVAGAIYPVQVTLAPSRRLIAKSTLRPPIIPPLAEPTRVTLVQYRRKLGTLFLSPPAVVAAGIVFQPIRGYLFPLDRTQLRPVKSELRVPLDVVGPEDLGRIAVHLAPSFRGRPKSALRAPVVLQENEPTKTTFARITPPPTSSRLFAPVVVFLAVEIYGPEVTLARITPPPTLTILRLPTDTVGQEDQGKVLVHLAPSFRGQPKSILRAPVIPPLAPPVKVTLARIKAGRPVAHLFAPAVAAEAVTYAVQVTLARITPQPTTTRLRAPVVVDTPTAAFGQIAVQLAPRPKPKTISELRPPASVARAGFQGVVVHLTRNKPKPTTAFLNPPRVVGAGIVFQPIRGYLFPLDKTLRRPFKSVLRPPVVIGRAPFAPITVTLAPSRRPITKTALRKPIIPPLARPTEVTLVRIRPPRTRTLLRPMLFAAPARPIEIALTRIRPQPTVALLKPPAVVGKAPFRGIAVHVARITPPPVSARLQPPTVVRLAVLYPIRMALAPSRFPQPKSLLRPPAVVGKRPFRPLITRITRITPPPVSSSLKPPTVINDQPPIEVTIFVHLAPSSRGRTIILLGPGFPFRPQRGEVCGVDEPAGTVCSEDEPVSSVQGEDELTTATVQGGDAAATVQGGDDPAAGPNVCGSDSQAT